MFPPVNSIPKQSAEDTTIVVGNNSGGMVAIPCPKGTSIALDTPGLHYNRMFIPLDIRDCQEETFVAHFRLLMNFVLSGC